MLFPRHLLALILTTLPLTSVRAQSIPVPYNVKQPGQISLAIYDQQSHLIRTLLTGAPRNPGNHMEAWDGCDRYGNPQPPGKYTWKLLETKGITAEFLLQVGNNAS